MWIAKSFCSAVLWISCHLQLSSPQNSPLLFCSDDQIYLTGTPLIFPYYISKILWVLGWYFWDIHLSTFFLPAFLLFSSHTYKQWMCSMFLISAQVRTEGSYWLWVQRIWTLRRRRRTENWHNVCMKQERRRLLVPTPLRSFSELAGSSGIVVRIETLWVPASPGNPLPLASWNAERKWSHGVWTGGF